MKNYLLAFGIVLLTLTSCEDKVAEPTCIDGYLNNGETDVDCGGPNCDECFDELITPRLFADFKDSTTQYESITATLVGDTFYIAASMSTSTINFGVYTTPNFDGTSDTSIIVPNSYNVTLGNLNYNQPLYNDDGAIASVAMVVDQSRSLVEGSFYFATEITSGIDTISVENGQFIEIPYE